VIDRLDAARQALVVKYMPLAGNITGKLVARNSRCDKDDALAEAHFGLVEAARRFEPVRGVNFATYAGYWIKARLLDYIMRVSQGQVRYITTAGGRKVYFQLGRAQRELQLQGKTISNETLAEHLGVHEEEVATARARREVPDLSINAFTWTQDVEDTQSAPVDESVILAERHGALLQLVWRTRLKPREQQIVRERWLAEHPRTLDALADAWGVSRQRAYQIEELALNKLRVAAGEKEKREQRKARIRRRKFSKSRLAQSLP
jgi:RNA polymerase sigma-32 factor